MKSNPSRGRAKPVRDPAVEEAQVVSTPTQEVPAPPAPGPGAPEEGETLMPTVENEPNSVYVPKSGCSIVDNFEILMMYLLHITGSPLNFAEGVLRQIELPASRVAQLSASSRRHMQEVVTAEKIST